MNTALHRPALLALVLLAAPVAPALANPAAEAQAAAAQGNYRAAAGLYQEAARSARGGLATDYLLLAAESLLASQQAAAVDPLLQGLPPASLDSYQFQRAGLLRARARLALGDAAGALQVLPATLDAVLADPGLDLRAQAQFGRGEVLAGVASRVARDDLLAPAARAGNWQSLWRELGRAELPDPALADNPRVRGWIELAQLARQGAPEIAYQAWRAAYAGHPGESLIDGLFVPGALTGGLSLSGFQAGGGAASGRQFALLLPLSGTLAGAAQAIRAGAEAARSRAGDEAPGLSLHDTAGGLDAALRSAMAGGAGLLIGPLLKEQVSLLAGQPPPLPTVALNYLDAGRVAPAGLLPFGLAPEDEARAAAEDAAAAGRLRAVVLAQEGDWGERAAAAFRSQLESRGGVVLAQARFRANAVDFSAILKSLLSLDAAEARSKQLAAIGIRAESAPHPRGDLDAIFVAARAPQARLIWPQLRFFRAGRIATYAPAAASDAGSADLGGLRVCDAPWRLETGGEIAVMRGALATVNPRSPDAQRLFALGYDAYEMARRLQSGGLTPGELVGGLSGELVVEADAALHRRLRCLPLVAPNSEALAGEDLE